MSRIRGTRKRKSERQRTIERLDGLFSEYIRRRAMLRAGGCEKCGGSKADYKQLQAAHFHGRGRFSVRWDVRNSVGVCGGCHRHIDAQYAVKQEFALSILGQEDYDRLYVLAYMTSKQTGLDLGMVEMYLREELRRIEKGNY